MRSPLSLRSIAESNIFISRWISKFLKGTKAMNSLLPNTKRLTSQWWQRMLRHRTTTPFDDHSAHTDLRHDSGSTSLCSLNSIAQDHIRWGALIGLIHKTPRRSLRRNLINSVSPDTRRQIKFAIVAVTKLKIKEKSVEKLTGSKLVDIRLATYGNLYILLLQRFLVKQNNKNLFMKITWVWFLCSFVIAASDNEEETEVDHWDFRGKSSSSVKPHTNGTHARCSFHARTNCDLDEYN